MRYPNASTEDLDIIRINECDNARGGLATSRFRALWNKIEELQAAVKPFADIKIHEAAPDDAMVVVTDLNGGMLDTGNRVRVGDIRAARRALGEEPR